jgi:hypothetical protein
MDADFRGGIDPIDALYADSVESPKSEATGRALSFKWFFWISGD